MHLLPGLDPPLILYFPRLVCRTFLRLFRLAPPCSLGCEETASQVFFSRESMIWWYVVMHTPFYSIVSASCCGRFIRFIVDCLRNCLIRFCIQLPHPPFESEEEGG